MKKIEYEKSLEYLKPEIAKQWHPKKNENLLPSQVTLGSNRKVWWKASCGHEWDTSIEKRVNRNQGCPYCNGSRVNFENSLASTNPTLASEWNYKKNGELKPEHVREKSKKKVWWICSNKHEWDAVIGSRSTGIGCPYCSGRLATKENNLALLFPDILKEWDYEKNNVKPEEISPFSGQKAWWIGECRHSWDDTISHRTTKEKRGCPYCSGYRLGQGNDLLSKEPEIAKQWHYEKNGELKPETIYYKSSEKVWWKASCGHEWETAVKNRQKGTKCPYCVGLGSAKKVDKSNSLAFTHKKIVKFWDFDKNQDISPEEVSHGSSKEVWWKCKKEHSFKRSISGQVLRKNCLICSSELRTSFPEQAIFYYMRKLFPDTENRYIHILNKKQIETDIFIPSLNLAIEYDGGFFHEKKQDQDIKKSHEIMNAGINFIRIRDKSLPFIHLKGMTVFYCVYLQEDTLKDCLEKTRTYILNNNSFSDVEKKQIDKLTFDIDQDRQDIYEQFLFYEKKRSIAVTYPDLVKYWHPTKNGKILPEYISFGSNKKVWFLCENNHEWSRAANGLAKSTECPYCAKRLASNEYNLGILYPELMKEWDWNENKGRDPYQLLPSSNHKVSWICSSKQHKWKTVISHRTKNSRGCPYCVGQLPTLETCLATKNPLLAQEWHPRKNNGITPYDVMPNARKKAWWYCSNCKREWEAFIVSRNKASGRCHKCYKKYK